jgi:hypothetical protein
MDTLQSVNMLALWAAQHPGYTIPVVIWTLAWKGYALWRAAQLKQRYWFLIIFLTNTLALLDIIYLLVVSRRYQVEIVEKSE